MGINKQKGFTIVELVIAIAIIGILSTLSIGVMPSMLAQGRDKERISDIDTLHNRLEEYFTDSGGYPGTITESTFKKMDIETLRDPKGQLLTIHSPTASFFEAMGTPTPSDVTPSQYSYTAYPTGCGTTSTCTGYILKTYIEYPTDDTTNPYIRTGINNN